MVIVVILSPLLHTYDLRAGNQITRRIGTLHITHHTSHHTHLSIHPIPPKEKKKRRQSQSQSHSPAEQGKKKPTGNVTPPLTSPSRKAPKPGTRHRQASRHLRTKQKRKTGCLHTYVLPYITYIHEKAGKTNTLCHSLTNILANQHMPSQLPEIDSTLNSHSHLISVIRYVR